MDCSKMASKSSCSMALMSSAGKVKMRAQAPLNWDSVRTQAGQDGKRNKFDNHATYSVETHGEPRLDRLKGRLTSSFISRAFVLESTPRA